MALAIRYTIFLSKHKMKYLFTFFNTWMCNIYASAKLLVYIGDHQSVESRLNIWAKNFLRNLNENFLERFDEKIIKNSFVNFFWKPCMSEVQSIFKWLLFTIRFYKLCQKISRKLSRKLWRKDYWKIFCNLFWKPCMSEMRISQKHS